MFEKEGWENWYKESEEGRQKEANTSTKEVSKDIPIKANTSHFKEVKKVSNVNNQGNILEPIGDAIFNYIKWFISCWIEPKFSIEKYFKTVELKNKEEVYPTLIKKYQGSKGQIHLFNIPIGLNLDDFLKHKESIKAQANKDVEMRYRGNFIEVEIVDKTIPAKVDYIQYKRLMDSICIPIGISLEGFAVLDLKENPHSYIVGTTGSGKSVCTKGILTSLITMYKPHELEIYLGDLKRVELNLFANVKHCKRFVYTVEDVTELIADLLEETNRRYDLFMEHGVTSIFEYNQLPRVKKLKYQVLYLEEIVMLLEDKKKKAMKLLKQLIAISRASGLYVFITTQRPSNDIIDNVVKANINNRIVFKCEDVKNSIVALDREGAELLEGKGHGLLKQGANVTEFRSFFISDTKVKELIKPYIKPIQKIPAKEVNHLPLEDTSILENKPKEDNVNLKSYDLSFLD